MAKDPAFLFYSADFMMGTMLLSMEERGQYITLLSVMHQQGRLKPDEVEVVIKGTPSPQLAKKFKVDENGLWYNERLEQETEKRKKFTESRRNSLNINNQDKVHIYLLHDPDAGNYKIGSSKYPLMRLGEAQKKNPRISMYWTSRDLVIRSIEKELHQAFRAKKVKHDWFKLTERDLLSIINRECFRTNTNNHNRTASRTVNENENRNENVDEVKVKKESRENVPRATKIEVFEELFSDEIFVEQLAMTHKGKDIKQAFEECYTHHANAPNPPRETWEWKQKLNTWLSNTRHATTTSRTKKQQHTDSLLAGFAARYGSDAGSR